MAGPDPGWESPNGRESMGEPKGQKTILQDSNSIEVAEKNGMRCGGFAAEKHRRSIRKELELEGMRAGKARACKDRNEVDVKSCDAAERSDELETTQAAPPRGCASTDGDAPTFLALSCSAVEMGGRGRRFAAAEECARRVLVIPAVLREAARSVLAAGNGRPICGQIFFERLVCANPRYDVRNCSLHALDFSVPDTCIREMDRGAGSVSRRRSGLAMALRASSCARDRASRIPSAAPANKSSWTIEPRTDSPNDNCVEREESADRAEKKWFTQLVSELSEKVSAGSANDNKFSSSADGAICAALESSSNARGGAYSEDSDRSSPDCARRRSKTKRARRDSTSACTQSFKTSRASLRKLAARLSRVSSKLSSVSFEARARYSSGNCGVRI